MTLTTAQVREKLHIGRGTLRTLVAEGHLKPVNTKREGALKFFARFDEKAVKAFMRGPWKELQEQQLKTPPRVPRTIPRTRSHGSNGVEQVEVSETLRGPGGLRAQLDRIEAKVDRLLVSWS
jgi:hypothetical protein